MNLNTINLSDNLEFIKSLPDNSIDAIITDSPYGLGKEPNAVKCLQDWIDHGYHEVKGKGFMGKNWDAFVPQPILWKECYRVLKPGGYLLSFFGTRTYDWGTLAIRLAGFEIRDCIQWIYGSGFPKSKACLKPANEPICVARKPGPLQLLGIDEAKIPMTAGDQKGQFGERILENCTADKTKGIYGKYTGQNTVDNSTGRWPANVIFDEEIAEVLDEQSGVLNTCTKRMNKKHYGNNGNSNIVLTHKVGSETQTYNDLGGASRFFYIAKVDPYERAGCKHPTIKPISLMTQLVKLYCPVDGIVLDPHSGTGRTAGACIITGRNYIMIDNDPDSVKESELIVSLAKNGYFTKEKNYTKPTVQPELFQTA